MQRIVDHILAVIKESVKTFTYECLNNIARYINGISAILLAFLPGKATILEGIHGWELRPTFRGPGLPRWMENGVSSFNQFIFHLAGDASVSSAEEHNRGDGNAVPSHPSQDSRVSEDRDGSTKKPAPARLLSLRRMHSLKDYVVHRATDKRRGVIEDLHLGIEIFIEAIFDMVHKAAHYILSPSKAFSAMFGLFFFCPRRAPHDDGASREMPAPTSTESRRTYSRQVMNTDARTCEDVITEFGYPYESMKVVTDDGYILLLERLPRRDAKKVVYLQHGILDSSMGWVSNGAVGSPAFAAYDQGYDVFLGNFRGLVSREHTDRNISPQEYWRYSINEHAVEDIPAMVERIHEVKTAELTGDGEERPYSMCAICHSLGGAAILMYLITRRMAGKPHRLSRLVLLSPAGFHEDSNFVFSILEVLFLWFAPLLERRVPGLYIPTRFFRMLLNKLARDFHHYPAVGGLVQTLVSYFVGGDSSNWVGVIGLPHYNMNDMPGLSTRVAHHLAQMKRTKKYIMYDYGSPGANIDAYGSPEPLNLGDFYELIDVPVDLVGGRRDQVIRPSMIQRHYSLMRDTGVEVSYRELEYAHLDFTFSRSDELLTYILSRLLLVPSSSSKTVLEQ